MNIFNIPVKETINTSLQGKSIMIVGASKSGKSTFCSEAKKPAFLMTENGTEGLIGFTPIPIGSWATFKDVVNQLCQKKGRETFDTIVIDSYTNLILLLDKYVGSKMTTDKKTYDFGSEIDYGKGTTAMKNELGIQLQKLINQGYLLLNIVHAEDKVDFDTGKAYIGTSLSNSLYGVAEKFVDQIIFFKKADRPNTQGLYEHKCFFTPDGGFAKTGGRYTTAAASVPLSYDNVEKMLVSAIEKKATDLNAKPVVAEAPVTKIEHVENIVLKGFDELMEECKTLATRIAEKDAEGGSATAKRIIEKEIGVGRKLSSLNVNQTELLVATVNSLKNELGE